MLAIQHWLERRQSGLFIQCNLLFVFFPRDYFFILYLLRNYNLFSHYFYFICYDICGCFENVFELKEGNIYRCC